MIKKRKIFIISNSLWSINNFRFELINEIKKKDFEIIAISFGSKKEKYTNKYCEKIIPFNKISINFFASLLNFFFLLIKSKPDYVLSFTHIPNIVCSLFSIFFKYKLICNLSWGGATTLPSFKKKILFIIMKFSLKNSFKTFFQNYDDYSIFSGQKKIDKYSVLPGSGVPNYKYKKRTTHFSEDSSINLINVSRLIPTKGLIDFCEAAKHFKYKHKRNINFYIQSSFKMSGKLTDYEKQIISYHKKKIIKLLPYKHDIRKLYNRMDIAVCNSVREGTPRFLIEAISCGLPIIASDVPGCREICINNYNGYLYKYGDLKSLIKKILIMIDLGEYPYRKLCNNSYKLFCHRYEIRFVVNSYLKCLN